LLLDHALAFAGTIAGFGGQDAIVLSDIAFGANMTLGYSAAGKHGTLTVSNGSEVAKLALQLRGGELRRRHRRLWRNVDHHDFASATHFDDGAAHRLTKALQKGSRLSL
jgi:hypothetical protein